MRKIFKNGALSLIALLLVLSLALVGCNSTGGSAEGGDNSPIFTEGTTTGSGSQQGGAETGAQRDAEKALGVPAFSGTPYAVLNGNVPKFEDDEITDKGYEFYSELDSLGRCGYTEACVGKETMPTEERESISSVKPTGWVNNKYDTELVEGGYVYNRAHLIGFQLTGENANDKNLITGTRYMNVQGMLPFENLIADYVKETDNHVMYRVTPIYDGNDLVACGVQMEAYSVEDDGEGVCFNVYIYNVQPGIVINYATGENWLSTEVPAQTEKNESADSNESGEKSYVLNTNSKKIHLPDCSGAQSISEANRGEYEGDINELIEQGYTACGICKPAA